MKLPLLLLFVSSSCFAGELSLNVTPSDKSYSVFVNNEDGRQIKKLDCTSPCTITLNDGRYLLNVETKGDEILRGSVSVRLKGSNEINLELFSFGY